MATIKAATTPQKADSGARWKNLATPRRTRFRREGTVVGSGWETATVMTAVSGDRARRSSHRPRYSGPRTPRRRGTPGLHDEDVALADRGVHGKAQAGCAEGALDG